MITFTAALMHRTSPFPLLLLATERLSFQHCDARTKSIMRGCCGQREAKYNPAERTIVHVPHEQISPHTIVHNLENKPCNLIIHISTQSLEKRRPSIRRQSLRQKPS